MTQYIASNYQALESIIIEHIEFLRFPLDSYMEDTLFKSQLKGIYIEDSLVGYFAVAEKTLNFFYIKQEAFYQGAAIFEEIIRTYAIDKVVVLSSDQLLNVLLVEWHFEKKPMGCFFTDSKRAILKSHHLEQAQLRIAKLSDVTLIRGVCGDFFDEEGSELSLEDRIDLESIFILGHEEKIYGCGIIEKGCICKQHASIGMFTNPEFRKMGVARSILLGLKENVYNLGLEPIAGCWYYNTLSKASLESAGMVASSMAYFADLIKKEKPPKRTGNPPGELVE